MQMEIPRSRMQRYRERLRAQGAKAVEIWLDGEALARVARLKRPEEPLSDLIGRALAALEGHGGVPSDIPLVPSDDLQERSRHGSPVPSDIPFVPSDALHPLQRKAELLRRLQTLKAEGMSLQAITDQLNAEGLPTLSGRGTWKKGTVGNLLAEVGGRLP